MNRQKIYDGPMMPVLVPAVDVQWISSTTSKTTFDVHVNYKQYLCVFDYKSDFRNEVWAEEVGDIDDLVG